MNSIAWSYSFYGTWRTKYVKFIISCVDITQLLFDSSTYFSSCMVECKNSLRKCLYFNIITSLWRSGVLLNFCLASPRRALRFAHPKFLFRLLQVGFSLLRRRQRYILLLSLLMWPKFRCFKHKEEDVPTLLLPSWRRPKLWHSAGAQKILLLLFMLWP